MKFNPIPMLILSASVMAISGPVNASPSLSGADPLRLDPIRSQADHEIKLLRGSIQADEMAVEMMSPELVHSQKVAGLSKDLLIAGAIAGGFAAGAAATMVTAADLAVGASSTGSFLAWSLGTYAAGSGITLIGGINSRVLLWMVQGCPLDRGTGLGGDVQPDSDCLQMITPTMSEQQTRALNGNVKKMFATILAGHEKQRQEISDAFDRQKADLYPGNDRWWRFGRDGVEVSELEISLAHARKAMALSQIEDFKTLKKMIASAKSAAVR